MTFSTKPDRLEYMKTYCAGCFFKCPYCRELNKIYRRYKVVECRHNGFVDCVNRSECKSCGWNPEVARDRLEKYRRKLEKGEGCNGN